MSIRWYQISRKHIVCQEADTVLHDCHKLRGLERATKRNIVTSLRPCSLFPKHLPNYNRVFA